MENALAISPLESPLEPASPSLAIVKKPGKRLFTPENAREMAARATAARAKLKADRIARAQMPDPVPVKAETSYVQTRIEVMRAHIERLDKRLAKTTDPQQIKWLSDSIAKLQDTERILDGRPAPANFKPKAQKRDSLTPIGPLD